MYRGHCGDVAATTAQFGQLPTGRLLMKGICISWLICRCATQRQGGSQRAVGVSQNGQFRTFDVNALVLKFYSGVGYYCLYRKYFGRGTSLARILVCL